MMTDVQFAAWLADPAAIRTMLFEVGVNTGGVETTRYLATAGYVTSAGDIPANVVYQPIIVGGMEVTESISLSAEAGLSVGDIELLNLSGARDAWLDDIWVNRPVMAWVGDMRWPRADFRLVFDGVVADIGSRSADRLNLTLCDKLQRLNTPVSDAKLGGDSINKDAILPLVFGEAHNITPLLVDLVDQAGPRYQVHGGAVEQTIEARSNGMPISLVLDNAHGMFTLTKNPFGTITASVQGDKGDSVYRNTIASLVQRIVTGYGKASDRFTLADLDLVNLAAFDAAHRQPVGLYLADRTNVLVACQQLAGSVGAQLSMSRTGKLRLLQIDFPPAGAAIEIRPHHIVERSMAIASRTDVVSAVKLGYCKNWSVQQGLATTIPDQHKELFAQEWLTVTASDADVESRYRLNSEPVQQDTCLLKQMHALAEAARRLAIRKVPRTTYRFEATPRHLLLELGAPVHLFYPRFGLDDGGLGVVTSLSPDWMTGRITVEVTI